MGGIRFADVELKPQETAGFIILAGLTEKKESIAKTVVKYRTEEQVENVLEEVKSYWQKKVNVSYETGDADADNYMKWISFQPVLRRIYGCSFLPYHDYGKGGRGWRDLWRTVLHS